MKLFILVRSFLMTEKTSIILIPLEIGMMLMAFWAMIKTDFPGCYIKDNDYDVYYDGDWY